MNNVNVDDDSKLQLQVSVFFLVIGLFIFLFACNYRRLTPIIHEFWDEVCTTPIGYEKRPTLGFVRFVNLQRLPNQN